jgi:hypothetical protein
MAYRNFVAFMASWTTRSGASAKYSSMRNTRASWRKRLAGKRAQAPVLPHPDRARGGRSAQAGKQARPESRWTNTRHARLLQTLSAAAFSQTLSQAHAQRSKDNAPAPQAAKPATPAAPSRQANADKAVPAKPAEPAKGNSTEAKGKADAEGQQASVDAQGESADGPAVASAPAEMPVADMLALVASFLPEKAASVVKDTPAAEAIAVRAARAADLAPVAPRAAQATDVVDTITPAFDAALADSAAAAADASAAALPSAPRPGSRPCWRTRSARKSSGWWAAKSQSATLDAEPAGPGPGAGGAERDSTNDLASVTFSSGSSSK